MSYYDYNGKELAKTAKIVIEERRAEIEKIINGVLEYTPLDAQALGWQATYGPFSKQDAAFKIDATIPYPYFRETLPEGPGNPRTCHAMICQNYIQALPGCCAMAVTRHYSQFGYVPLCKGLGSLMLRIHMEIARRSGYALLQATTASHMYAAEHILAKHGWEMIRQFRALRSEHMVKIWLVDLTKEIPNGAIVGAEKCATAPGPEVAQVEDVNAG